ncbi:MAG TPA: VWA domain-containing protein [Polyangiaceae bacterium]|nr:VWA domain-containing protein [Polyangiaceae bacterium]
MAESDSREQRWRLVLGQAAEGELDVKLTDRALGMDRALEALYESERQGSLGASSPNVARWLGDIRSYFPAAVVKVLQQDAIERLNLKKLLLEPEMLEQVEPDVNLVATLLSLKSVIPARTRETARSVVRKLVEQLQRRLQSPMHQALRGALSRAARTRRPRGSEVDWDRTLRKNLSRYQPEHGSVIVERLVGYARRGSALRDVVLCVDQSGSMASSVVYSSIFAAVLASLRSISTRFIVFDTAVVDLTEHLHDPVELLFGTQLGGGTDIAQALTYCQQVITRPTRTVLVLITDLYEGGDQASLLARVTELKKSGVTIVCLLALNDAGAPSFDHQNAQAFASLGIPTFACTPDLFPDLMSAALLNQDVSLWAARQDIVTVG